MSLGSPQYRKKAYAVAQRSTPDHAEFGPNEWLVDELHQQYLADKNSVDPAWWEFFADYQPSETPYGQSSSTVSKDEAPSNGQVPDAGPSEVPLPAGEGATASAPVAAAAPAAPAASAASAATAPAAAPATPAPSNG